MTIEGEAHQLRHRAHTQLLEPTGTTLEALAAIMAADTAHWASIVKASGFGAA